MKKLWPAYRMVRGSPRQSSTNGGVERLNRTIEHKLGHWMRANNTTRWSIGCKIVTWRYNTQIHTTIGKKSPYHITFGQIPRCGISNLPLSTELLENFATEEQLASLLHNRDLENLTLSQVTAEVPSDDESILSSDDGDNVDVEAHNEENEYMASRLRNVERNMARLSQFDAVDPLTVEVTLLSPHTWRHCH